MKYLISEGALPNIKNFDGNTPLNEAAIGGHIDIVTHLLTLGANVNQETKKRNTPIKDSWRGHIELVKDLIDEGVESEDAEDDGWTPLLCVCAKGRLAIAECLVSHGADVNQTRKDGVSPLHIAASNGYLDVVRLLLSEGAQMGIEDNKGNTLLHRATDRGHLHVIDYFLKDTSKVNW